MASVPASSSRAGAPQPRVGGPSAGAGQPASQGACSSASAGALQPHGTAKERLLEGIRRLGRRPQRHPKATDEQPDLLAEHKLAESYRTLCKTNRFTQADEQEIDRILSRRPRAAPRAARPAAVASSSSASASRTSRGAPLDPGTPARASASSSSRAPGGASQPAASPAAACAASPACATPAPAAQASDTMTPRTEAVVEQVLALGHAPRNVGGEDKLRRALQRKREEAKTSTDAEAQLQVLPQGHRSDCDK